MAFLFIGCQLCNEQGTVNGGQCNEQTGQCICKNGFTGEKCYLCSPGKYGINCNYGELKLFPKLRQTLLTLKFLSYPWLFCTKESDMKSFQSGTL